MTVSRIPITLPEIIIKAKAVADQVGVANIPIAQKHLELLYEDGNRLVKAEVEGQPLLDNTLKVALELNEILSQGGIEGETAFLKSLAKVYRLFLELTWYQFVRRQQLVYKETREAFAENSQRVIAVLPQHEIATRFEYKCAKQAVKFLSTPEALYSKYLNHLTNLVDAASSVSITGIFQAAKAMSVDAKKDWIKSWYPDIHQLRWMASTVQTLKDFNIIISPEMSRFKELGYQYTLCLTTILFDLIRKPEVEEDVKQLAMITLVSLLSLKDEDRFSSFLNILPQSLKPIEMASKKADRYYLTRKMLLQGMGELIKDERFSCFKNDMRKALLSINHQHEDEKISIKRKLAELQTQEKSYAEYIKETEEYLASTQGGHRAGEAEEVQKAEEELSGAREDKEAIELEIKTIESVESALENMNKEEEALLEEIKAIIGY